jgi:hypothetical protein
MENAMAGRPKGPHKKPICPLVLESTFAAIKRERQERGESWGQVLDRWAEERRAEIEAKR